MTGQPRAGEATAAAAQALQEALDRWEASERTGSAPAPSSQLKAGATTSATSPAGADEAILPLLQTAQLLYRHRQQPSPAFRRQLADALAEEAAQLRREHHAGQGWGLLRGAFSSRDRAPSFQWALRAAAVLLALGLGLGALTVAQAARHPEGWAGRLLRATRELAEEALPGLLPARLPRSPAAPPTASSGSATPAPSGAVSRTALAPPAGDDEAAPASAAGPRPSPGVVLGRKPGHQERAAGTGTGSTEPEDDGPGVAPQAATPAAAAATAPAADRARAAPSSAAGLRPAASPTAALRAPPTAPSPSATPPPPAAAAPGSVGATLSGRLELGPGRPLKNVPVSVFRLDAGGKLRWWDPAATVRSDGEGRYRLEGLAPGSYKLMAGYLFPLAPRRWYPAAARSAEAEALQLGAGQTLEGIDLRFSEAEAAPLTFWAWLER